MAFMLKSMFLTVQCWVAHMCLRKCVSYLSLLTICLWSWQDRSMGEVLAVKPKETGLGTPRTHLTLALVVYLCNLFASVGRREMEPEEPL